MSVVYITHHDENIYNIEPIVAVKRMPKIYAEKKLPKKQLPPCNQLRENIKAEYKKHHIQQLNSGEKLVTSSQKYKHQTMGCAKTPMNPPCDYLRKNEGIRWRREKEHVCAPLMQWEPVPRAADAKKPLEKKPNCNFIAYNIQKVKNSVAKRSMPRYIDTVVGARHNLIDSGLTPQYICRKDFAKVPKYLTQTANEVEGNCVCTEEGSQKKTYIQTQGDLSMKGMVGVHQMHPEEHKHILKNLKKRKAELINTFQNLPFFADTIRKRKNKSKLETELNQIERDIELFETTPVVYVSEI